MVINRIASGLTWSAKATLLYVVTHLSSNLLCQYAAMIQFSILIALLLMAGCASSYSPSYQANDEQLITGFPGLPDDAR